MKTQNENSFIERHVIKLSKKRSPKTDEELKSMLDIPNASAIGNIKYVVQCTRPDVAFALSITSRYHSGTLEYGQDHYQVPKKDYGYVLDLQRYKIDTGRLQRRQLPIER
ncbi:UNVERIFIED_CONTAM: Retrovirus-related Pol polyprotein from transposon TNT 1-94 [Sesamum radiatum]|uniref:Retrovirus-related Pol polyprotein from transposon TNT 1-94 n=1 Tax=Sesamum radiatum TaxID=300843 RepID=A0AAW2JWY6_SESRA